MSSLAWATPQERELAESRHTFRAAQFIWGILLTGLTAALLVSVDSSPVAVNFALFNAVLQVVSSILFTLLNLKAESSRNLGRYSSLSGPYDFICFILIFCAGIVMAAGLGPAHSCYNVVCIESSNTLSASFPADRGKKTVQDYVDNNVITSGSTNNTRRCQEAQVSTVFFFFATFNQFICFGLGVDEGPAAREPIGPIILGATVPARHPDDPPPTPPPPPVVPPKPPKLPKNVKFGRMGGIRRAPLPLMSEV
ncbi:MAG: hypothetical protein M1829_005578 [Trizodia sp. TS-e1964]|nr:MAG: hypothetical protein M1829_005578 [Trizodia sp. TS-e1964]